MCVCVCVCVCLCVCVCVFVCGSIRREFVRAWVGLTYWFIEGAGVLTFVGMRKSAHIIAGTDI